MLKSAAPKTAKLAAATAASASPTPKPPQQQTPKLPSTVPAATTQTTKHFTAAWSLLTYPQTVGETTHKVCVTRRVADLGKTFFSGQAFTWQRFGAEASDAEVFRGVCCGEYFELRYRENTEMKDIEWRGTGTAETLADYLSMHIDYAAHFDPIAAQDKIFADRYNRNQGLRVMRQDPWECLIAFICSQNNNVKRIGQMVRNLCRAYGPLLYTDSENTITDGEGSQLVSNKYYGFPEPEALAKVEDQALRDLGFGYRAPYMIGASKLVAEKGGRTWLNGLRGKKEGRELLQELPGVGPKVSDCICIYALDLLDTVPLDVHMKRVAADLYGIKLGNYEATRLALVEKLGGKYAGIGQTFMFASAVWKDPLPSKDKPIKEGSLKIDEEKVEPKKPKKGKIEPEDVPNPVTEAKPKKIEDENQSTLPTKGRLSDADQPSPIIHPTRLRVKRATG